MGYMTNVNRFCEEIRNRIGGEPGPIQTDEGIHRFDIDKRGDKVGWYVAFSKGDFIAGAFGSHKESGKHTWNSGGGKNRNGNNAKARAFFDECFKKAEEKRQALKADAKKKAARIWNNAKPALDDHPYLIRKGIKAHGARQYKSALIVPVEDKAGEIASIQFIAGDGSKRFLKGGSVVGGSFTIPGEGESILCEGFATACSIAEATCATVKIAFNAGNLLKVAEPGWTIAGDNDAFTTDRNGEPWNPGRQKALAGAWEHNCRVVIPMFPDAGMKPTDFNDLHCLVGLEAVKEQIGTAVYPHEFLLKEVATDVGAPFREEHIEGMKQYRERNQAGYMKLRSSLKRLRVGVTELEKALKTPRIDDYETVNHLTIAREVGDRYGEGNLIHTGAFTWQWDDTGLWQNMDDRAIKQVIHTLAERALEKPTKTVVDSILDLTKTEIFNPGHKWDVDQTTINCLNGEIGWTGQEWMLIPHCREHYRTTQIPVVYDSNAIAPRFDQFLYEVFNGDSDSDEKRVLVCELMGYTLLSSSRYEKFVLLIGPGANGKSVLMDAVAELVGFQNVCAVQPSQFESKFQRGHLHNKLMNCVTELAQGAEIHDAQLKSIVSGEITTAEHKWASPFDFQPFATCWFGSNHMPHTRDFSDALFRRAVILPFNRVFSEPEQDKNLKDKLKAELPGILNHALDGIAGVFDRGSFTQTESSTEAKNRWRLDANQVAEFAADECRFGADLEIESGQLYQAYKSWGEEAGIRKLLNRKNFTQRMERLGAKPYKGSGGIRMIAGVDLANSSG